MAKPSNEVALVAVHGVADQGPGETARAIVDLLVSSAPDGVCYQATASTKLTLPVAPLEPRPATSGRASASPSSSDRGLWKSLRQSLLSDIHRPAQACDTDAVSLRAMAKGAMTVQPMQKSRDAGITVSDYLLRKYIDNGAEPEAYETEQSTLEWEDKRYHMTQLSEHPDVFDEFPQYSTVEAWNPTVPINFWATG